MSPVTCFPRISSIVFGAVIVALKSCCQTDLVTVFDSLASLVIAPFRTVHNSCLFSKLIMRSWSWFRKLIEILDFLSSKIYYSTSASWMLRARILVWKGLKTLKGQWKVLVYTTQVNSAFRALWLVNSEVISKHYSPPSKPTRKIFTFPTACRT